LKAVHHIVASSAETVGAFNTGFEAVNLHHLAKFCRVTLREGMSALS
jgi:hypothetical protein